LAGYGVGAVLAIAIAFGAYVAQRDDWKPDAWAALGTWTTAGVALVAGLVALGQLAEARVLRREQAQPYVVAFIETSAAQPNNFVEIVARNFGATAAYDVRLKIDPPPRRATMSQQPDVWLPERIPVLVPGQEWRTFWDAGHRRFESDLPRHHKATVDFADSHGRRYTLDSILDWDAYFGRSQVSVYGTHHSAKALQEISTTMKRWQETGGGLAVHTRDGDTKDERQRARIEARGESSAGDHDEDGSQ
jgi:hypothetical protein